jgi:hypothetical protein
VIANDTTYDRDAILDLAARIDWRPEADLPRGHDVSEAIRDILVAEGITVRTGADCIRLAIAPAQTNSGCRRRVSRPTRAATSPSTIRWPRTFRASGPRRLPRPRGAQHTAHNNDDAR